jgi:hypothetical protein
VYPSAAEKLRLVVPIRCTALRICHTRHWHGRRWVTYMSHPRHPLPNRDRCPGQRNQQIVSTKKFERRAKRAQVRSACPVYLSIDGKQPTYAYTAYEITVIELVLMRTLRGFRCDRAVRGIYMSKVDPLITNMGELLKIEWTARAKEEYSEEWKNSERDTGKTPCLLENHAYVPFRTIDSFAQKTSSTALYSRRGALVSNKLWINRRCKVPVYHEPSNK